MPDRRPLASINGNTSELPQDDRLGGLLPAIAPGQASTYEQVGARFLVPGTLADGTTLGATHLNKSVLVNGGTINLFIDTAWANGDSIEFICSGPLPTVLAWAGGSIVSQDTGAAATQVIGGATAASAYVLKISPGLAYLFT
jgi:hypothetical protein